MSEAPSIPFAVVGGLREDYFITPDDEVHLRQLGGNAVYAAVGARLWADSVGLVARIGSNYPREWLPRLAERGLDTSGIVRDPGPLDNRTFYAYRTPEVRDDLNPAAHFARVGCPFPPALAGYATSTEGQTSRDQPGPLGVRASDVPAHYLQAHGFHLSPFDFSVQYSFPAWLRQQGVGTITCDPSVRFMLPELEADVAHILRHVDAFLPSEMETRGFFAEPLSDLWAAVEAFGALGAPVVVLKLGARGQYVYDTAGRRRWRVPAYPARVVDVTGAGDAYCGGFLVGFAQTGDPVEAAVRGCVTASLVVEGTGALYALDRAAELEARAAQVRAAVQPL
ncbi:MAG: carbohydrate kinase family protein [Anaerolineales bacterium]|nr:carbohydrate kinase family protein [Anaerolineales bacterium]